jgi:hypothetical protein
MTAYETALATSAAANAAYRAALADYRAMKIGDAEFLAAKAIHNAAQAAFDIAFEAAQNEPEEVAAIEDTQLSLSI